MIAEPEITSTEIVPGDDFVVIASDGLWDVFTSQEAVDFVRKVCAQTFVMTMIYINVARCMCVRVGGPRFARITTVSVDAVDE